MIINYLSKDGEDKFLQYEDMSLGKGKNFTDALKEKVGIQESENSTEL